MKIAVLLACATLAACQSASLSMDEPSTVPQKLIYGRETRPSPGAAVVSFARDWNLLGGHCQVDIFIDGGMSFALRNGDRQKVFLAPGHHSVRSHPELCGGATFDMAIEIDIRGDTLSSLRIFQDWTDGGAFHIEPTR